MTPDPDPYRGKFKKGYVVTQSCEGGQTIVFPLGWDEILRTWQWHPLPDGFYPIPTEEGANKKAKELMESLGPVWVWQVYFSDRRFRLYEPRDHWTTEPKPWTGD